MKCTTTFKQNFHPYSPFCPLSGVKKSKQFFSENGHVANQIKGNETYNNMQANILPLHKHSTPGRGLKVITFFSSECSHIAYQMNRKVGHAHTMVIYTMGGLGRVGEVFFNR